MKQVNFEEIFAQIAKAEGISKDEVKSEIYKAILIGFNNPEKKEVWKSISIKGDEPTIEEVIEWVTNIIK